MFDNQLNSSVSISPGKISITAPLYEALVKKCQALGIAGITVLRGMEGYGEASEIHRRRILAHDQPIIVTVVESAENIDRLMPEIEKMVEVAPDAARLGGWHLR